MGTDALAGDMTEAVQTTHTSLGGAMGTICAGGRYRGSGSKLCGSVNLAGTGINNVTALEAGEVP